MGLDFIASTGPEDYHQNLDCRFGRFEAHCCPPVLLHVCHQSRAVVMASFKKCLTITPLPEVRFYKTVDPSAGTPHRTEDLAIPYSCVESPSIWFQPRCDTLYFDGYDYTLCCMPTYMEALEMMSSNIQSLAIDEYCPDRQEDSDLWQSLFCGTKLSRDKRTSQWPLGVDHCFLRSLRRRAV
jgi:hypothetical protein